MYSISINGNTTETSNFEAAKATIKAGMVEYAAHLAKPVRAGLYRSPKTTARINAERAHSASKLVTGVKLPKKAEDVAGSVGGCVFAITRK